MADKSFGVKELNLLGSSGTPSIESPNDLNLNANTVAISTDLTVGNKLSLTSTGIVTAVSGIVTFYGDGQYLDNVFAVGSEGQGGASIDGGIIVGTGLSISGISTLSTLRAIEIDTDNTANPIVATRYNAGDHGATLFLQHSKTNTIGVAKSLSVDDEIGSIEFRSYPGDDTTIGRAARIGAIIDADPTDTKVKSALVFETNSAGVSGTADERLRITSEGDVGIGTTGRTFGGDTPHTPALLIYGGDYNKSTLGLINTADDNNGTYIFLGKQRGVDSVGIGTTTLENGDNIGQLRFLADDGNDLNSSVAAIESQVDGIVGVNSTPGRIKFLTTPSGSNSPTERLRITSDGYVGIATTNPQADLQVGTGVTIDGNSGVITATKFVAEGSTGYLKADGTVDSGTFADGAIANIVDDENPQLGGDLDGNSKNIDNVTNLKVTGITTLGNVKFIEDGTAGIVTAVSGIVTYYGDGSKLSGVDATTLKDTGGTTRVEANTDGVYITGITTFTTNVDIGGTLTYEDVTNIDSVGIITANAGIRIGVGGTVGPVGSGIVTYYGDGSGLDKILTTGSSGQGAVSIDDGNIVGTALSISGISSVGTGITMYGATGIISATEFHGNGEHLSALPALTNSQSVITPNYDYQPPATYTVVLGAAYNITWTNYSSYSPSSDRNGDVTGADPTININLGDTIVLDLSTQYDLNSAAGNAPTWIKTQAGTGTGNSVTNPIATNNGDSSQTADITWTPNAAGTYYYQSEDHANMVGQIIVTDNGVNNPPDDSFITAINVNSEGRVSGVVTFNGMVQGTKTNRGIVQIHSGDDNLSVSAGIVSISQSINLSGVGTISGVKFNSGIVTAVTGLATYYGDGSHLVGLGGDTLISGITVQEEGSNVGTGGSIKSINFIGDAITATQGVGSSEVNVTVTGSPSDAGFWVANNTGIHTIGNIGIGTTTATPALLNLHAADSSNNDLIVFSPSGSTSSERITMGSTTLDNGTISFEGSEGTLFSITNNLSSGSIFAVNDISGIPVIDVDANGTISMVPFGGSAVNKVGIGTTSPHQMLDVRGNVVIGIDQVSGNPGNTIGITTIRGHHVNSEGDFARLYFSNSLSASGAATRSSASIRGIRLGDNLGTGLGFWTNPTTGANPGVERLRIDQNGRVGIGTSVPGAQLHLAGPSEIRFNNATDAGNYARIRCFEEGSDNGAHLVFNTGAGEAFRLTNAGVGSFTSTPRDHLGSLRDIPVNAGSSQMTLAATDAGRVVATTSGGWVIPATLSSGNTFTLLNDSSGGQTIDASALTTLYNTADGVNVKGNTLTLGARSMATIWMGSSTVGYIQATALTVS